MEETTSSEIWFVDKMILSAMCLERIEPEMMFLSETALGEKASVVNAPEAKAAPVITVDPIKEELILLVAIWRLRMAELAINVGWLID